MLKMAASGRKRFINVNNKEVPITNTLIHNHLSTNDLYTKKHKNNEQKNTENVKFIKFAPNTNVDNLFDALFITNSLKFSSNNVCSPLVQDRIRAKLLDTRQRILNLNHDELKFITGLSIAEVLIVLLFQSSNILGKDVREAQGPALEEIELDSTHAVDLLNNNIQFTTDTKKIK